MTISPDTKYPFLSEITPRMPYYNCFGSLLDSIELKGDRLFLKYRYNPDINAEIKTCMFKYQYHPELKQWSVLDCHRNRFHLARLIGRSVWDTYDALPKAIILPDNRPLLKYQQDAVEHILTRRHCMIALPPGTGKTLTAVTALELANISYVWWVGPKSALYSVQLELEKWKSFLNVKTITYEGLGTLLQNWQKGNATPRAVVFDESPKMKTPTAVRSQACRHLADNIRDEYGLEKSMLIAMSGTPAPNNPVDYYNQIEIVQPGYIRQGDHYRFENRMGLFEKMESKTGGSFPKLVTWWDNPNKCAVCGQFADNVFHSKAALDAKLDRAHEFVASIDQMAKLATSLKPIMFVRRKEDCLDLPEKRYRVINVKPTAEQLRLARQAIKFHGKGSQAMVRLREISDGFLYEKTPDGEQTCEICKGEGEFDNLVYTGPDITDQFLEGLGLDSETTFNLDSSQFPQYYEKRMTPCSCCGGSGKVVKYKTGSVTFDSPKLQVLMQLLDEYEDCGRFVVYGAFHGIIDEIVKASHKKGWDFIKADGRGWESSMNGSIKGWLKEFQNEKSPRKIIFIGQPTSASTGLTLTRSPVCCFFSNTFGGDDREQASDRIHRLGMDANKGATIIDLFCLPVDRYIMEKVSKKIDMQDVTMGELATYHETELAKTDYLTVN